MAVKQVKKNAIASFEEFKAKIAKADLNTMFIFGAIILVLVVGMYAIFAPKAAEVIGGNPACGKIVIAADGASLRANVSPTLAGAKYFLVVDPLTKKILEKVKNPYTGAASPGRELIYLIAGKGEEAVIVGDIDPQSYGILSQFGIKVFGGYTGKVKNVVGLYRQARVSPMSGPTQAINAPNVAAQAAFVPDINTGAGNFVCPQCRWQTNYPGAGGAGPMCPRCRICMQGQNCPIGGIPNGMGFDQTAATPVAFGLGDQSFICPTCNWRMKCKRQGNTYPNCPNCGSGMAQDMANQGFFGLKPGEIFAANTAPVQNYYQPVANNQQMGFGQGQGNVQNNFNQMQSQPNFWQGRDSNGYFVCPNCNWRMYSERPLGEYPRCPNCKQIMARGGLVPQNNGNQNYIPQNTFSQSLAYQAPVMAQGFGDQFAGRDIPQQFAPRAQAYQAPAIQPPPIYKNSPMVHDYRGVCTNCHQILNSQAPAQGQGQGAMQNDPAGAQVAATCVLR
jgi:predicted Fe-Mo cluster-binding NifX family protein/predicted RNA-binding Zn-ribbon protein involved in translation (DUF1610 family)